MQNQVCLIVNDSNVLINAMLFVKIVIKVCIFFSNKFSIYKGRANVPSFYFLDLGLLDLRHDLMTMTKNDCEQFLFKSKVVSHIGYQA